MLFGILTLISGIIEMNTLGAGEVSLIQRLMSPDIPEYSNPIGAVTAYMSVTWQYLEAFFDILFFNYSFFQGQWLLVKYILFIPVSFAMVFSLIMMLRGVASA